MPTASRITWLLLLRPHCWPGLVSHVDSGSHTDMEAYTFRAGAAITPFFGRLTLAGAAGSGMDGLRAIGLEAERAVLEETGGVDTHRGAIFGLGLLCSAAGTTWSGAAQAQPLWGANMLGATVRRRWSIPTLKSNEARRYDGDCAL